HGVDVRHIICWQYIVPLHITRGISRRRGWPRQSATLRPGMEAYRKPVALCRFIDRMIEPMPVQPVGGAAHNNLHYIRMSPNPFDLLSRVGRVGMINDHRAF